MDLKRILPLATAFLIAAPTLSVAARMDIEVDRDTSLLLDLNSGTLIVQTWNEDRWNWRPGVTTNWICA